MLIQKEKLIETLQWLDAIGVDEPIVEDPFDKTVSLEQLLHKSQEEPASKKQAPTKSKRTQSSTAVLEAKKAAADCTTLDELRSALESFEGCPLKATATNLVFSDGNPEAGIMVIGEAPGADEDREGIPFSGDIGQFFAKMLSYIGLKSSDDYYLTNIINWRPPGNRTPSDSELEMLEPFLKRHIELVNPKILIFVGGLVAKTLLNESQGITKLRGKWHDYKQDGMEASIPAYAVFHPAYLLRQPMQKKKAWADLLDIKKKAAELKIL